jgi:SAM-dependent methyltransferase
MVSSGPMTEPEDACRLCGECRVERLLDLGEHPIAHRFLKAADEPEYVHRVELGVCAGCGLVQLLRPIPPERLYADYFCLSSWKAQPHLGRVVDRIRAQPGVGVQSRILEVGSNDGILLDALRTQGFTSLLGIEPARDAREAARARGLETVEGYFTPDLARRLVSTRGPFDVVAARQVLEHVQDLGGFLEALRIVLRPGGHVLIEVPHFDFCLDALDYSAIWEEHVNYFTRDSLRRFLAAGGLEVRSEEAVLFSGEALITVATLSGLSPVPASANEPDLARTRSFAASWPGFRAGLLDLLTAERRRGGKVGLYGAGCRACSLVNFAGLASEIDGVFDDQAEKQGLFLPGARLPVRPGSSLSDLGVTLCLLAVNAENEEKVVSRHPGFSARGGRFASVLPPSPRLIQGWTGAWA